MNRKSILQYLGALAACFLIGCCGALLLSWIDALPIRPLEGGQTLALTGFSLCVPEDYVFEDLTRVHHEEGGDAIFCASLRNAQDTLLVYCYRNETGDSLEGYDEQALVTHYMRQGASQVRTRTLGGRRFICYRVSVETMNGTQAWDTYETWDETLQIAFETQMPPARALSILATIQFDPPSIP
ncbi:MAG: hypothetical protein ACI4PG_09580 [Candidatus Ventricola sp.]